MSVIGNLNLSKATKLDMKVIKAMLNRGRYVIALFMVMHFIGGTVFYVMERSQDYSFFQSQYWASITGYTVGYGDMFPKTDPGRALAMVYIPLMQLIWTVLVAIIIATVIAARNSYTHLEQERDEAAMMVLLRHQGLIPADATELPDVTWFQQNRNFKPSHDAEE